MFGKPKLLIKSSLLVTTTKNIYMSEHSYLLSNQISFYVIFKHFYTFVMLDIYGLQVQ